MKIVQLDEATKLVEKKLAALEEEYVHLAIEKNKLAEERSTFETIRKTRGLQRLHTAAWIFFLKE